MDSVSLKSSVISSFQNHITITNWASTYAVTCDRYYQPTTVQEVQDIVLYTKSTGRIIRAVGSGHSPNDCAMTNDIIINLDRMNKVLNFSKNYPCVQVEAGIKLHELTKYLDTLGYAIPNLGSISEQSVAGCISTGTHGTGKQNGLLATYIMELQIVCADGTVKVCNHQQNKDIYQAALCSLGCLGIITGVVLAVVPAFDVLANENSSTLSTVLANLPQRIQAAPLYRFWWFPHTDYVWEWSAQPVQPIIHRKRQPTQTKDKETDTVKIVPKTLTQQLSESWEDFCNWYLFVGIGYHVLQFVLFIGIYLPFIVPYVNKVWRYLLFNQSRVSVDRSDKAFNFDCLFKQHVDEWAIPVENVGKVLEKLRNSINDNGFKAHYPIEIRFVAGDDIPLSPAYGRATAYIGIIAYKPYGIETNYKPYFQEYERIMGEFQGRPHWAKDFGLRGDKDFAPIYPLWYEFKALRNRLDPTGVFANAWVKRTLDVTLTASKTELPTENNADKSSNDNTTTKNLTSSSMPTDEISNGYGISMLSVGNGCLNKTNSSSPLITPLTFDVSL